MGRLNNVKSRCFRIELYEDTDSYNFIDTQAYIESHYDFVAIRHDKDVFESDSNEHKAGDPKKTHWHYIIRWEKAPRTASGVAKELGHILACSFSLSAVSVKMDEICSYPSFLACDA